MLKMLQYNNKNSYMVGYCYILLLIEMMIVTSSYTIDTEETLNADTFYYFCLNAYMLLLI